MALLRYRYVKNFLVFLLLIVFALFSYLLGANNGFYNGWVYAQSLHTNRVAYDIAGKLEVKFDNVDEMKRFIDRNNRLALKNGLIEYGRYLDRFSSRLPWPVDARDATTDYYKNAAKVYTNLVSTNQITVESPEEIVKRVEKEMIAEGDMDFDLWNTQRHIFLQHLKEEEYSLNLAIQSLGK